MSTIINCPNCSQGLEIDEYREGASVDCPNCGNEFTTPSAWAPKGDVLGSLNDPAGPLTGQGGLSQEGPVLPERLSNILHPSEKILYTSNPSKNALVLSMILAGILWSIIGLAIFFVGIVVTLPAALFITYHSWKNRFYIITDSRTIVSEGVMNISTKIVMNKNIQFISINTGIIDRRLNLNSVELATAANGGGNVISSFSQQASGSIVLKWVKVEDVLKHYWSPSS